MRLVLAWRKNPTTASDLIRSAQHVTQTNHEVKSVGVEARHRQNNGAKNEARVLRRGAFPQIARSNGFPSSELVLVCSQPGRAEAIRIILRLAGVDFEVNIMHDVMHGSALSMARLFPHEPSAVCRMFQSLSTSGLS